MRPLKRTARLAGLLYLLVTLTAPFVLIYVPGKLFVSGDAAATVDRILAHQSLYRASIVVGIVDELAFIGVVLVLYRLLRDVSSRLATLMVILIFLDVPLAFASIANQVATLAFARGAKFLAVFDKPQRDALATLFLQADRERVLVSMVFWGLWLLPLGLLVYRSGFLPRFLGVWLFINGLAYLATCFAGMLAPDHVEIVRKVAFPALFGEAALMLWLLIVGAREPLPTSAAS